MPGDGRIEIIAYTSIVRCQVSEYPARYPFTIWRSMSLTLARDSGISFRPAEINIEDNVVGITFRPYGIFVIPETARQNLKIKLLLRGEW